ncbi:penicillin-binding protein 2 [Candidatus Pantoea edessiphila]|uniref:Peptidoglycan D,D-transpeptidase MrdA n=1 Tax=Candidatus Pantoea edessiphila TaxID=2044610 RepID=A0A2P5SZ26_9GAMM|nr:penicillin-binding protein 2 [Candidatus Pantoea edessiphila]MBK4775286.1 penicillin-binding protein 2 [Pantoea sp. Edef]PPI87576.1 penicillin-binding protein 2 [Candidatus Pantoea edessiphila]
MIFKNCSFHNHLSGKKKSSHRILIVFSFILIVLFAILMNIYYLQVVFFSKYQLLSIKNHIKLIPFAPQRGIIYDRNGIPLAINRSSYQLEISSKNPKILNETISNIRKYINITDYDLENLKKNSYTNQYFNDILIKYELNAKELAYFVTNRSLFPGINVKKCEKRYYPFGKTLSHVIGYTAKINDQDVSYLNKKAKTSNYIVTKSIGKSGIEAYYEDMLHGRIGYEEIEINGSGNQIRVINKKPPISGNDIYLTIDLKLQQYIEKIIENKGRISVIATDPQNGEILAMVSNPSFDANLFAQGISNKNYQVLLEDKDLPLYNRVTQAVYPPASTVKPYLALTALEAGMLNKHTNIFDPGWWKIPGSKKYYNDWKKPGHGYLNITKSIEESSDTFFYQIAYNMGIDYISEWMIKFGFGKGTGIDLPQEKTGKMPTREWKHNYLKKSWYQGDTIPIGIGQGYWTATPLQMNKALIILINNGIIKIPHILHSIDQTNARIFYNKPFSNNSIKCNPNYWHIVKDAMYGVANRTNGTGYQSFADAPYKIAAKSGTAQIFSLKERETYNSYTLSENLRDHKLMNAFAPYKKPCIAVTIIMENSNSNYKIGEIMRHILDFFILHKKSID